MKTRAAAAMVGVLLLLALMLAVIQIRNNTSTQDPRTGFEVQYQAQITRCAVCNLPQPYLFENCSTEYKWGSRNETSKWLDDKRFGPGPGCVKEYSIKETEYYMKTKP